MVAQLPQFIEVWFGQAWPGSLSVCESVVNRPWGQVNLPVPPKKMSPVRGTTKARERIQVFLVVFIDRACHFQAMIGLEYLELFPM